MGSLTGRTSWATMTGHSLLSGFLSHQDDMFFISLIHLLWGPHPSPADASIIPRPPELESKIIFFLNQITQSPAFRCSNRTRTNVKVRIVVFGVRVVIDPDQAGKRSRD